MKKYKMTETYVAYQKTGRNLGVQKPISLDMPPLHHPVQTNSKSTNNGVPNSLECCKQPPRNMCPRFLLGSVVDGRVFTLELGNKG